MAHWCVTLQGVDQPHRRTGSLPSAQPYLCRYVAACRPATQKQVPVTRTAGIAARRRSCHSASPTLPC